MKKTVMIWYYKGDQKLPEKPKIKLSELADMYDIEDPIKPEDMANPVVVDEEWEVTIIESDKKIEDEMDGRD